MATGVVILGSTGSIGTQALDVLSPPPRRVPRRRARGRPQHRAAREQRGSSSASRRISRVRGSTSPARSPSSPRIPTPTSCSTRSSGFAGLPATLAALDAGKRLALAEQGEPDRRRARSSPRRAPRAAARSCPSTPSTRRSGSACAAGPSSEVARIVLTASGGPFRGRTRAELADVQPTDALAHPTWNMGAKITIDSLDADEQGPRGHRGARAVRRRLRPRSTSSCTRSRSCTAWSSSSTARRSRSSSMPDMRLPIGLALGAPHRLPEALRRDRLDHARHPHVRGPRPRHVPVPRPRLRSRGARAAPPRRCSAAPTRSRCEAFLAGRIAGRQIAAIVEEVLEDGTGNADEVADVLDADREPASGPPQ